MEGSNPHGESVYSRMNRGHRAAAILLASLCLLPSWLPAQRKPAPPPSRYAYRMEVDAKSLPPGVTVRKVVDGNSTRHFIRNAGTTPLIINEVFSNQQLVGGAKLVEGKVYGWFPNGVPMEGKTHLKGWQAPFGDIVETLLFLPREPAKITEGRRPGLGNAVPADEPGVIGARHGDAPYEIKVTIRYRLNDEYGK